MKNIVYLLLSLKVGTNYIIFFVSGSSVTTVATFTVGRQASVFHYLYRLVEAPPDTTPDRPSLCSNLNDHSQAVASDITERLKLFEVGNDPCRSRRRRDLLKQRCKELVFRPCSIRRRQHGHPSTTTWAFVFHGVRADKWYRGVRLQVLERLGEQAAFPPCSALAAQPPIWLRKSWTIAARRFLRVRWIDRASEVLCFHAPIQRLPNGVVHWAATPKLLGGSVRDESNTTVQGLCVNVNTSHHVSKASFGVRLKSTLDITGGAYLYAVRRQEPRAL